MTTSTARQIGPGASRYYPGWRVAVTLLSLLLCQCCAGQSPRAPTSTPNGEHRLVELTTRLPQPGADDRVEVYDAVRGRVVSFPGHLSPPRRPSHHRRPQPPLGRLFSRQVWSAAVSDTSIGTFVREVDLPRELVFGSYWARAAFSEDGRHLYLTGPFNTQAVYLSTVGPKGRLGPWQATRSMPASQNGRRSLHQIFVAGRRLHVLGGWWADNNPGIRQIHAAVVGQAGAVGPFRLLSARVPFVEVAFSLARCGGRIYLARGDTIWVSARGEQGALTAFEPALTDARLQHENYGGTGLACGGDTLVLADEARTHLLHLGRKGRPALVQSLQNPAPFRRRTVFCHRGRFFVTTTHGGRIYRLSR